MAVKSPDGTLESEIEMPVVIAPTGTARASALRTLANGDIGVYVMHFQCQVAGDPVPSNLTQLEDIKAMVRAWIVGASPFASHTPALVTSSGDKLRTVTVRSLDLTNPIETSTDYNEGAGTSGDVLPAQLCAAITWKTGVASRRTRGRTYIGPLVKSTDDANGAITSTAHGVLDLAAQELVGQSTSADTPLIVYSRRGNIATVVTDWNVDSRFDVQRRRANRRLA